MNAQDAFFPRSAAAAMPTIVAGRGPILIDDHGRQLIDVCSGPFLASIGQGNERVLKRGLVHGLLLYSRRALTVRASSRGGRTRLDVPDSSSSC